ncbi:hypothetical protein HYH03_017467 [Edaphochlamys debaryana]|uniref:Uncharacterized protein n=1 Tax=Edaphochlamys debaryana TaxID=47281 RepID=A0A835XP74_9CHLO|nr:hypothetical protein HYH03_017467 [Edaphochlamys debaryana]|eukprot:KAG2483664.1 hypothetical protein HYH03_017467 [Edaphochlamys debaryana]
MALHSAKWAPGGQLLGARKCSSLPHGTGRVWRLRRPGFDPVPRPLVARAQQGPDPTPAPSSPPKADGPASSSDGAPTSSPNLSSLQQQLPKDLNEGITDNTLSALDLATATSFIEKIAGAVIMYGITVLLSMLSGVDSSAQLLWDDGAPLGLGAAAALPAVVFIAALFAPSIDPGLSTADLKTVARVDQEEDATAILPLSGAEGPGGDGPLPEATPEAARRGLWFYQIHVLKPWFPAFSWGSVGFLYAASCAASSAQELLVRGYGGALLTGWYGSLLAGATDATNPIYWAKVFKLVTPDTSRWLAAFSLIALQVALSSSSATRASRFTRVALNKLGRVPSMPGTRGMVVQDVSLTLELGLDASPKLGSQQTVSLELPTAEERVVYGTSLAVSVLLCGCTNCAWAASGSLLGSYTAQVVIDGVVTALQQVKATRLPERELWEAVIAEEEAEEAAAEAEEEAEERARAERNKGIGF